MNKKNVMIGESNHTLNSKDNKHESLLCCLGGLRRVCWFWLTERERKHQLALFVLFSFGVSCLSDPPFRSFLPLSGKLLQLAPHVGFSIQLNPMNCATTSGEFMFRFCLFGAIQMKSTNRILCFEEWHFCFFYYTLTFFCFLLMLGLRSEKNHTSSIIVYHIGFVRFIFIKIF